MASSSNPAALLLGLAGCAIYGYSFYSMALDPKSQVRKLADYMPESLRPYGQLKFLTFQCLIIQLLSSVLHVLAHFIKPLRSLRDLVFTSLAYPVGSLVVISFWAIWFVLGRELIFPAQLDAIYPPWLNHATHTVLLPLNLLLLLTVPYKYGKYNASLNLAYLLFYTALLFYIKHKSGHFVYLYLDYLNYTQKFFYFAGTGLFGYVLLKSGEFLASWRGSRAQPSPGKARKQKQK